MTGLLSGWLAGLMQRLEQRIIHSSVWLSLYKLYKFIWRTVFYSRSQLERLCRQAVLDSSQGQPFQAYPTASNWLPGRRLLFSLLRRIPFIVINGDGYEQINDADDGQDDKYSSTPPLFSHRLLYQIDRSILYSTQLTVNRRQLESKETTDIYPIYVNILNRKSFRNDCTNKDQQTAAGAAAAAGALFMALLQIHCTFRLLYDLNDRSSTRFDSQNKLHERRLYDLYTNLLPGQPLPVRISKDWQRLGFQGQDPATDFRGMGLLGLDQLLWFARRHQRSARLTLQHSWDESGWYTWACVGINITALLMDLLRARMLQLYLYSAMERWTRTGGGERWIETHWRAYLERKQSDEAVIMVADKHDSDISVISGSGGGGGDSNSRRRSAESETEAESPVLFLREAVAELYSFAFTQFDQYWLAHLATTTTTTSANPAILQFPKVFKSFKGLLEEQLLSGQITFESIERYFTTAATATTDLYNK